MREGKVLEHTVGRTEVVIRSAAGGGVTRSENRRDPLPESALTELAAWAARSPSTSAGPRTSSGPTRTAGSGWSRPAR